MHYGVLCLKTDMRIRSSAIFSDNTPTVAWCTKMADNSSSQVAGRLLRGFAMLQLQEILSPVILAHVAGDKNKMADYASRSYNTLLRTTTNTQFLAIFNSTFLIQCGTCTSVALPTEIISNIIILLRGRRLVIPKWTTLGKQVTGSTGKNIARKPTPTSTSCILINRNNRKCLSYFLHGSGQESSGMEKKCMWDQWVLLYERFCRQS